MTYTISHACSENQPMIKHSNKNQLALTANCQLVCLHQKGAFLKKVIFNHHHLIVTLTFNLLTTKIY